MSIFNTILQKFGIEKPVAPSASPKIPGTFTPTAGFIAPQTANTTSPSPVAIPVVDVMAKLNNLAGSNTGLDWKVSIVDLLKLLGIDSSLNARKELATELGCPADLMNDSAKMNTWLHQTVLQKIAQNGGNIPASLLH
jgi:hypothetical protein